MTTPQANAQGPTPVRIFETMTAYQQSAALKAAIELDLFTAVAEGADQPASIAARTESSERGVRILCDYLTVCQFLEKRDGRYRLTPESKLFLVRTSPAYVGAMSVFLGGDELHKAFRGLTEAVRRGTTTMEAEGSMTAEHPMWEDFARGMAALQFPASEAIAALVRAEALGECKVLDVAAGHGVFGVAIARHNPQAQVYALDWANVLPYARANAERAGVAERFHEIPGSAFEVEWGNDYDLVLLTNFFHHFDRETCVGLMRKAHAALKDGGRAVTQEFVPNEDRVSPPVAASFSMMMLGTTPSGDAYTFSELDQMFRNAGFASSELHALPPTFQQAVISYK